MRGMWGIDLARGAILAFAMVNAALFNLSRLSEVVEHRVASAADEAERRASRERMEQEAGVAEHLDAYERGR